MAENKESIKTRIVLPVILFVFILLLLAVHGSYLLQQYHLNAEMDGKIESVNQIFSGYLAQESDRLEAQLDLISRDENLLAAWKEKNRDKLYQAAQPIYEKINLKYGVSHFYFIDPDRTCFLRVHAPDRHGDLISRKTLVRAVKSAGTVSGIELGPLGTVTLRVVFPWMDDHRLIGYLELGEEIENLASFLKTTLGLDFIFLIDKEHLGREEWEYGNRLRGKMEYWDEFKQFVVINKTTGALNPRLRKYLAFQAVNPGNGVLSYDGRHYRIAALPLMDAGMVRVGRIIALYDTTEKSNAFKQIIINISALVFAAIGLLFIFFYYYTDRLEEKLDSYQDRLEKKVAERTSELSVVNEKLLIELAERRKIQEKLKRSKEEWRKSFNALSDIVTIQNKEMKIIKANRAAYDILGKHAGEIVGKHCYEVFRGIDLPCDGCPVSESLFDFGKHTEIVYHQQLRKTFHVSSSPILDEHGEVEFIVHAAKDITLQKKMEEELFQSRKLEAIGTLAGGIAHDFNNILMAILGYIELARENISDQEQAVADLDEASKGAQRARELVRQILVFSRKDDYEIEPLFPHLVIKESLKLLRASLPTSIRIQENIDPECGSVLADPVRIQQIMMNLCTNALHAMEHEEGVLRVSLERKELTADEVVGDYIVRPGPYIELTVSDTGHGMSQETMEHIFEPFFTTKDVDKGTGMGLAVVHGIVRDFGGMIKVESAPGKGSTFTVYLPLMGDGPGPKAQEEKGPELFQPGSGRILCVDDERPIVRLQKSFFERLGYEVAAFTSSLKALEHFRKEPQKWDLLITDQTMPEMTGENLVREILKIRPELPVIICTGYSSQISEEKATALGIKAYVLKPIDMKYFETLVRKVLAEAEQGH
jgi:PAS domain S-box-containing protein